MSHNHYINHNRRILNAVAGEQHAKWERDGHRHKLKKAKKSTMPMAGVRFNCFSDLSVLV